MFSSRGIPFLTRLRRRLRHAWLLHAWLIFSLLLMPAGRRAAHAADDDAFTLTSTESAVSVSVYASEGTSGMQQGESRQVIANVQLNTWEVWTNSVSGTSEIRNSVTSPMPGASLSFSACGTASVSPAWGTTDGNGNSLASFTMGSGNSIVAVTESGSGATGSITFAELVIGETWQWDHDESLITASLSTTDSTNNVQIGATPALQANVTVSSWSVYVSNLGNTRTDNTSTSPAIGASVYWSIQSGDGSVSPGWSATDGNGNATATLTMGGAASTVRADVSFATASSTYATLDFTPATAQETWSLDHVETSITALTLGADGSTDALDPGAQRNVTATVTQYSQEVWVSNLGNTEYRNAGTSPAQGASVSFSISYGDGSLSSSSGTTDSNGSATVGFTMGSQNTGVGASSGGQSASIDFYRGVETWNYDHTESSLSFSGFSADGATNDLRPGNGRTLTATVTSTAYDVWVSNYGNTDTRNYSNNPASGVNVGFSVISGDGQLSSSTSSTNSSGEAAVGFTMGQSNSMVQAEVNDGTHGSVTTSLTLSLGNPVWTYNHTETTISTTLTSDGTTDMLPPGAVRGVTANVTLHSWDVWMDDVGNTENRNDSSGAANGASVYFSVTQGDGTISTRYAYTDSNGNATTTFTMGTQASTVQADASYASASSSGTITFTSDPWVYDHAGGPTLNVSLSADDTTSTATATVTVTTWDVYSNGAGSYEDRDISTGPAGNAYVNFSADGDVTVATASATTNGAGIATTGYTCADDGQGTITSDASFMDASATDTVPVQNAQNPPVKCVEVKTEFPVTVTVGTLVGIGGKATMKILDKDDKPTGTGGMLQEKIIGYICYFESLVQLPGDTEAKWHEVKHTDAKTLPWHDCSSQPVNADGIFIDEPIGFNEAAIKAAIATCKKEYPDAPAQFRRTHTHQYRIKLQGKTYPADDSGLTGEWNREVIGALGNDGKATITSFTSTPKP